MHDFAGHAVTLVAGLPEERLEELLAALGEAGLAATAAPWAPAGGERRLTLRLVFARPDEAARRPVPPVPG